MITIKEVLYHLKNQLSYLNETGKANNMAHIAICNQLIAAGHTELPAEYRKAWHLGEFKNAKQHTLRSC